MLVFLLLMTSFTGIGMLHLAQITGLVRVQVSIEPEQWVETGKVPAKK